MIFILSLLRAPTHFSSFHGPQAHLAHVILVSSDPKVAYALTNGKALRHACCLPAGACLQRRGFILMSRCLQTFPDELLSGRIISVNIDSIAKEPALKYLRKRLARSRYPREITEEEGEKVRHKPQPFTQSFFSSARCSLFCRRHHVALRLPQIFSEIGSAFVDLNRVEAHLSSGPHISVDQALDIMVHLNLPPSRLSIPDVLGTCPPQHRTTIAHIVGALGAEGRSWTPTQLWRTIKMLAESVRHFPLPGRTSLIAQLTS